VFNKDETVVVTSRDKMTLESNRFLTFIFIYSTVYMNKPNFWIYFLTTCKHMVTYKQLLQDTFFELDAFIILTSTLVLVYLSCKLFSKKQHNYSITC